MAISLIAFNIIGFIGDGRIASAVAGIMAVFAGFGCSIIYPTIMSIIGDSFPSSSKRGRRFCSNGWWHRWIFISIHDVGYLDRVGNSYRLCNLCILFRFLCRSHILLVRAQESKKVIVYRSFDLYR